MNTWALDRDNDKWVMSDDEMLIKREKEGQEGLMRNSPSRELIDER